MDALIFRKIKVELTPRFSLLVGTPHTLLYSKPMRPKIGASYFIQPYTEHLTNLDLQEILNMAIETADNLEWFHIAACTPEPYGTLRQYILARRPSLTMVEHLIINGGSDD
jgi:hypothetical protein